MYIEVLFVNLRKTSKMHRICATDRRHAYMHAHNHIKRGNVYTRAHSDTYLNIDIHNTRTVRNTALHVQFLVTLLNVSQLFTLSLSTARIQ